MFKKFTPLIAALAAIFIAGCGSSGKTNPPPVPPLQPLSATKTVAANTPGTIVVDDVTVNISPTTLSQSSKLTVTAEQTFEKPPKPNITLAADRSSITISSTSMPVDGIAVTLVDLNRSRADIGKTFYGLIKKTADGWESVSNFVETTGDSVYLTVDKTAFAIENGVSKMKATIAKIKIVSPIESRGLVEMADDPSGYYKTRVLVMVPGFNNTISNLSMAAMKIVDLHQYRKIYGFSYDYRNATNVPAKDLGLIIDSLASQGYEIDLLGHSRGGLICRATLENYSKTRKVLNFYSVCTPHEGVALANMGQLMSYLRKDYLNSTDDNDQPFGVLAFDTEAAAELFPNCSFIKKINDPSRIMFRGSVNYHIIGAKEFGITGGDYLAGGDTGLAKNVSLGQITAGAINRYYLPNNSHGSLLKTNDGLDELVHSAFVRTQGYLVFTVEPSDAHINLSANRWYFDLKFFNPVSKTYKFIDMSIDVYDKNAVWSSGCWYSPLTQSPDKFPKTYTFWNEFILPHATHYIPLESKTDEFETPYDDLFPADKAVTLAFIVRYQDTETLTYYSQRVVSRLIGPAGYPVEPTWRSPARGIAKNVHILRPGK